MKKWLPILPLFLFFSGCGDNNPSGKEIPPNTPSVIEFMVPEVFEIDSVYDISIKITDEDIISLVELSESSSGGTSPIVIEADEPVLERTFQREFDEAGPYKLRVKVTDSHPSREVLTDSVVIAIIE